MTSAARCAALLPALLLAACASVTPVPAGPEGETLSGRLAIRIEATADAGARSENAAFELRGSAPAGQLNLSTPLGSVLAQARWAPGDVVLATPQGERRFADLDALTREVLGESLPVAALFDWLRGRPWPGAPSTVSPASAPSPASPLSSDGGFTQLGWSVDLARFGEGWVVARRDGPPAVTVRARLD